MYRIFDKYKIVIINGLIFISLLVAFITPEGILKSFFIGMGTGPALVSLGNSFMQIKNKTNEEYISNADSE